MAKSVYNTTLNTRTVSRTPTPQTQAIPGREKDMAVNNAGGVSFVLDDWKRLEQFLILGSSENTYYSTAKELTVQNADAVLRALKVDGRRVVQTVIQISDSGRAPKNDPALFVLALAMTYGDAVTQQAAYAAVNQVARIGTHILHLASYVNGMRGWGRGLRKAFANWYNNQTPMHLAQQLVKYANRDGWTHRDILRLSHAKPATSTHDALFTDAVGKAKHVDMDEDVANYMAAVAELKASTDAKSAAKIISDFRLPREVVPTQLLNDAVVWEALLPHMGMTALVRNLATLTRVGIIGPVTPNSTILDKLSNAEAIAKSRIHPVQVIAALLTYKSGRSVRGSNTWNPNTRIIDTLDAMFDLSFKNVIPSGKRIGLFLDVSGSMDSGELAGVPGLSPRVASMLMAMVTMRVEPNYMVAGFTAVGSSYYSSDTAVTLLNVSGKQRLDDAVRTVQGLRFGATDCSLPFTWALQNKVELDAVHVYTDNETYAGKIQPAQALTKYRNKMGLDTKAIVVGMTTNGFSILDPKDAGSLQVAGFDTHVPSLISDFVR